MSLKKPILVVKIKCSHCSGKGYFVNYYFGDICEVCNGLGKINITPKHPGFKRYYIKKLKNSIHHHTENYRILNKKAQVQLGLVRKYCKELDRIINKK